MKPIKRVVILSILAGLMAACQALPPPKPAWRVLYEEQKQEADQAYAQGDYEAALELYRLHANLGSKFSQYRLAVMHEKGQGVEPNLVDAYAWATLAAEEGTRSLKTYRDYLAKQLTLAQKDAAQDRSYALYKKYSTYRIMEKTYDKSRAVLRTCTGSRIGNSCSRLNVFGPSASSFPIFFVTGSDGTRAVGPTVPGIDGFSYFAGYEYNLRFAREYLTNYGRAEYGEFRVVEDEVDETAASVSPRQEPQQQLP